MSDPHFPLDKIHTISFMEPLLYFDLFLVQHFYALIEYTTGECPAMMLASVDMKEHMKMHEMMKSFSKNKTKKDEKKEVTGWLLFQKEERLKVIADNPSWHHTKVSAEVGKRWNEGPEGKKIKKEWQLRAEQYNQVIKTL